MNASVRIGDDARIVAAIAATMVVVGQGSSSEGLELAPSVDRVSAPMAEHLVVGPGAWIVALRQMQMGRKLRIYDRRRGRLQ